MTEINRRDFLKLAGLGGAVFAMGLSGYAEAAKKQRHAPFYFVQLSDVHYGFTTANINPDGPGTLRKAVAAVNRLEHQPDFVIFTGDLTHTTDDVHERRHRMAEFRKIVADLKVKKVHFIPGEHDASLDRGKAYQEFFGKLHYSFDHKGVHFIVLDNVSDPGLLLGEHQLAWLKTDLTKYRIDAPIVVLTHRPLFPLFPQWDWLTRDGDEAMQLLTPHKHVTVFYGHIHQQHQFKTGHIEHYAADSLIFPLPAPGSVPKKAPIPWNSAKPFNGLGFREIATDAVVGEYHRVEHPLQG